jgi:AcrR family transcriptional regulator
VAIEAGTSLRATTYYFRSREALLTEALEHYADQALLRFARIQAEHAEPGEDPLEAAVGMLADAVVSDLTEDLGGLVAEYELVLEIRRRPELAACYSRWQEALLGLLGLFAEQLGSPRPKEHARLVLAALRGLEIEALARPGAQPDREAIRGLFRELLQGLALSHPAPRSPGGTE